MFCIDRPQTVQSDYDQSVTRLERSDRLIELRG